MPSSNAAISTIVSHRLSLDKIREASQVICPEFRSSPQYNCESLSGVLGCSLTIKIETTNPIRSFKGRGADYFLHKSIERGESTRLVCASAGNFGQALAYACRARGRSLDVFASVNVNPLKAARMQALGANLHLIGEDFDAAKEAAKKYCADKGYRMIEDGLEAEISEGAGTIAVELLAANEFFDVILIPLGNGALLNGMARWIKSASPATKVYGVSASGADSMEKSWRNGKLVSNDSVDTIADGVAVRVPIPEAVTDMNGIVDDVLLIEDSILINAMQLVYQHAGILLEPSGALGVAAVLSNVNQFSGLSVATVLCGANVTDEHVRHLILG